MESNGFPKCLHLFGLSLTIYLCKVFCSACLPTMHQHLTQFIWFEQIVPYVFRWIQTLSRRRVTILHSMFHSSLFLAPSTLSPPMSHGSRDDIDNGEAFEVKFAKCLSKHQWFLLFDYLHCFMWSFPVLLPEKPYRYQGQDHRLCLLVRGSSE